MKVDLIKYSRVTEGDFDNLQPSITTSNSPLHTPQCGNTRNALLDMCIVGHSPIL